MSKDQLVRCHDCGTYVLVKAENHHPWCMHCCSDVFDWDCSYDVEIREPRHSLCPWDGFKPSKDLA